VILLKVVLTWLPSEESTEMTTTERKARIKAYSISVWPRLRVAFLRGTFGLARIIS
jgi:hypothetical protein